MVGVFHRRNTNLRRTQLTCWLQSIGPCRCQVTNYYAIAVLWDILFSILQKFSLPYLADCLDKKISLMIHRLSYLVYGGQPRRILHCSSDVAEDERQAMMRWCGDLKPLGPYDEFISAGGISWVDVPTSTGRRLFVRVFATRGQSRDAWYFLGLILAEEDYAAIADYGRLVSFVESFSVASLLAERMTGSKVSIPIDRNAGASNEMPPLFRQTTDPDWTSAAWIQSRAKKTQHLSGGQLHIAFNPPAARGEYTTLLVSEGFVKPGLKLKPILEDDHGPNHSGENKKLLAIMKTPILLSLLVPAFAFGYLSKSSTAPSDLFPVATVTATDGGPLLPTI